MELLLTAIPENFDPESPQWIGIFNSLRDNLAEDASITLSAPKPDLTPKNAKGEPITAGAFIIGVASAPAVAKLIGSLNAWIKSLANRKVKVTIQSSGQKISAEATGFAASDVEYLLRIASETLSKS
jgi:hypothetical protein